ncbi:hypothetical protein MRX96_059149 [Rhipicephalus microplus]
MQSEARGFVSIPEYFDGDGEPLHVDLGTFRLTLVSQLYSVLGMNGWAQAIDYVNYNAPMNGIIGLTLAPPLYSVFAMDVWAQAIHGANYNALVNSLLRHIVKASCT